MSYTSSPAHSHLYRPDDMHFGQPGMQYQQFTDYSPSGDRYADSAAGEARLYPSSPSHIHPHPLFTRLDNEGPTRPLDPHLFSSHHQVYQSSSPFTNIPPPHHSPHPSNESSQSWSQYDHSVPQPFPHSGFPSYPHFPNPSPFPSARLTPPPLNHQSSHTKGTNQHVTTPGSGHRLALAGSLDPATGIFYRTPEHPRLRTAQACEKCRTRKAKCSGEHPSCKRCIARGLVCEYAKEGRVRGPNRPKAKATAGGPAGDDASSNGATYNNSGRASSRARTSSANSSTESTGRPDLPPAVRRAVENSDLGSRANGGRNFGISRRNSMGGNRVTRPRPPDLQLDNLLHVSTGGSARPFGEGDSGDNGYAPLHQQVNRSGFIQPDNRQHQHYDLQGNALPMQADSRGLSLGMSSISLRRFRGSGMPESQSDLSLSLRMPHHDLVPIGLPANIVPAIHSMDEELGYPPAQYFDGTSRGHHVREDSLNSVNSSMHSVSCGGSPVACGSAGTTSSMGSPLTPASTSSSSSLLPKISQQNSEMNLNDVKFSQSNGLDLHFDLDPGLAHPPSREHRTPEPRLAGESLPPLHPEQENHQPYHASMDMRMC